MRRTLYLLTISLIISIPSWAKNSTSFQENKDGTVTVVGTVVGQWSGCEVDGSCGFWVEAAGRKVGLITEEGDVECKNTKISAISSQIKEGDRIKAYGQFQNGKLSFCSSSNFYIVNENLRVRK